MDVDVDVSCVGVACVDVAFVGGCGLCWWGLMQRPYAIPGEYQGNYAKVLCNLMQRLIFVFCNCCE